MILSNSCKWYLSASTVYWRGFPCGAVVKNSPANGGDAGSIHPWVGKIPWRRKWQPTPVFLPGKSHGQRSLADYSPWGRRRARNVLETKKENSGVIDLPLLSLLVAWSIFCFSPSVLHFKLQFKMYCILNYLTTFALCCISWSLVTYFWMFYRNVIWLQQLFKISSA